MGLSRICISATTVLRLPMRDGNSFTVPRFLPAEPVLRLPMRDGSFKQGMSPTHPVKPFVVYPLRDGS